MKKVIISVLAVFMTVTAFAQVVPGMKYKELKNMYNAKEDVKTAGDPYSPGWMGFGSFVVPGLGQVLSGETGRGIAIFAGGTALNVVGSVFAKSMVDCFERDSEGKLVKDSNGELICNDKEKAKKMFWGMMGAGAASLVYDIWNICDAVKVAKIKNMYNQDLRNRRSMEVGLYPSVDFAVLPDGVKPVTGMTLSLQF